MQNRLFPLLSKILDMKVSDINLGLTKNDVYKWDSLVQMELVTSIENEFNFQMSMDEIVTMDSVKKIVDIMAGHGVSINDAV